MPHGSCQPRQENDRGRDFDGIEFYEVEKSVSIKTPSPHARVSHELSIEKQLKRVKMVCGTGNLLGPLGN